MPFNKLLACILLITSGLMALGLTASVALADVVDDFESGLPSGSDGDGVSIGFYVFNGASTVVSLATTDSPPAPVPGSVPGNFVMQVDSSVADFGGFIHGFENVAVDT